ncbi:MAG: hypothetical protein ACTSWE_04370 [Promethearchaeota archaeon]
MLFLAGVLGLFSVLSFLVWQNIGSWWTLFSDPVIGDSYYNYFNVFGVIQSSGDELMLALGGLGIFSGSIIILGTICLFFSCFKASKALAYLGVFSIIIGLSVFMISFANIDDYSIINSGLGFLNPQEYNVFYGYADRTLVKYTWNLSISFYICLVSILLGLISAIKLSK